MDSQVNWAAVAVWIAAQIKAVAATVGVTGVGVGLVKVLRHAPAPGKDSLWAGCLFDTFQDLASNDSRIGERRPGDGDTGSVGTAPTDTK